MDFCFGPRSAFLNHLNALDNPMSRMTCNKPAIVTLVTGLGNPLTRVTDSNNLPSDQRLSSDRRRTGFGPKWSGGGGWGWAGGRGKEGGARPEGPTASEVQITQCYSLRNPRVIDRLSGY